MMSLNEDFIIINGEKWVNFKWIKVNMNIKRDRINKWINGRGQASIKPLRFIKIGPQSFIYNYEDLVYLKMKTDEYMKTNPKAGKKI